MSKSYPRKIWKKTGIIRCGGGGDCITYALRRGTARDMVMIADHVRVVAVEGLEAYMALGYLFEFVCEPSVSLQPLLLVIERHHLRLESPQLTNQLFKTILTIRDWYPTLNWGKVEMI